MRRGTAENSPSTSPETQTNDTHQIEVVDEDQPTRQRNPEQSEREREREYVLGRYGLKEPIMDATDVRRYAAEQASRSLEDGEPLAPLSVVTSQEGLDTIGDIPELLDRGLSSRAINELLGLAEDKMLVALKNSNHARNLEYELEAEPEDGPTPGQIQLVRRVSGHWYNDAHQDLHAARALIAQLPQQQQGKFLDRMAKLLDKEGVHEVARNPFTIEMRDRSLPRSAEAVIQSGQTAEQQNAEVMEPQPQSETLQQKEKLIKRFGKGMKRVFFDPVSPFNRGYGGAAAYGVGFAVGTVANTNLPVRRVSAAIFLTTNFVFDKYARLKIHVTKDPERKFARQEKFKRTKKYVGSFGAGFAASGLASMVAPKQMEQLANGQAWKNLEQAADKGWDWVKEQYNSTAVGQFTNRVAEEGHQLYDALSEGVKKGASIEINQPAPPVPEGISLPEPEIQNVLNNLVGNTSEVIVQSGDRVEHLVNAAGISDGTLYNSKEYMQQLFLSNEQVFTRGNPEGAQALKEAIVSGKNITTAEFRKLFGDAVRFIFPGQKIVIPKS